MSLYLIAEIALSVASSVARRFNSARSTYSSAAFVDVDGPGDVWMPFWAMGFYGIRGRCAGSAKEIDSVRHWFKVVRIAAQRYAAQVVKFFVRWNWADGQFVHYPMHIDIPAFYSGYPVAFPVLRSLPQPTGICFKNALSQSFLKIKNWRSARCEKRVAVAQVSSVMF